MSNANDFIIENGVLTKYVGPGGDVVIPEGVTEIGATAFCRVEKINGYTVVDPVCEITAISFPSGLKKIGKQSFFGHKQINRLEFPDTLKTIETGAFLGCGLVKIEIPKSVSKIEADAFAQNPLVYVAIKGKTKIGKLAFNTGASWKDVVEGSTRVKFDIPDEMASLPMFLDWEELYSKSSFVHKVLLGELGLRSADVNYVISKVVASKKTLLPELAKDLTVTELKVLEKYGAITADNADDLLLMFSDNVDCRMELIAYTQKNIMEAHWEATRDKTAEREVNKVIKRGKILDDALAAFQKLKPADIKKMWKCITENAGLFIEKYNGADAALVIPAQFGDKPIIGVAPDAMRAAAGPEGKKNAYNKKMYKLKAIIVMEGIQEIGAGAFAGCVYLTDVCLPSSLSKIDTTAFSDCHKLTIHAPAGSYAEQYAKENNIPFVAE